LQLRQAANNQAAILPALSELCFDESTSGHSLFPQLRQLSTPIIQKRGFDTESLRPISKQSLSLLKFAVALGELQAAHTP
jgi:hypothetical protein